MARLTLARKIAAVALRVWKKGVPMTGAPVTTKDEKVVPSA
jgi:hypothetical protein